MLILAFLSLANALIRFLGIGPIAPDLATLGA
jgi:hypothetical protein